MKPAPEHSQTSQRVKVGMIGLAAVVLLIAVASAILGSASRDPGAPAAGSQAATTANLVLANDDTLSEPLADLGVAPGTGNEQTPPPSPPTAGQSQP